ncbi:MAG: ornithine carbamoyltransferase [Pseudomonadota bacterium]
MTFNNKTTRHFIDIDMIEERDLRAILTTAKKLKDELKNDQINHSLKHKQLAMIFEKPSTRTRVSFEVGINQLGGQAVIINKENSQISNGEIISDTAQVLSRYVDMIMMRCYNHGDILEMAEYASIPVINGLTNFSHPCQVMTDILTIEEHKNDISQLEITWIGDFNNMVNSWIHAANKFNFKLNIISPKEFMPDVTEPNKYNSKINFYNHISAEYLKNSDVITTDCWVSMGDDDAENKKQILAPFQVNTQVMDYAKNNCIFLHCLPAYRGEEVTSEVIDGKQSVIFDEAENRLHVQKAIMQYCCKV